MYVVSNGIFFTFLRVNKVLLVSLSPSLSEALLLSPEADPEPAIFTELSREQLGALRTFLTTGKLREGEEILTAYNCIK